jgi:predicted secreted Zn-dependent protease
MGSSRASSMQQIQGGTISDIMINILIINEYKDAHKIVKKPKTLDQWVKVVVRIASDIFPCEDSFDSKKQKVTDLRRAIFNVTLSRWSNEMSKTKLYTITGQSVAKHTKRTVPYDRVTAMYAEKIHKNMLSLPKCHIQYHNNYSELCRILKGMELM